MRRFAPRPSSRSGARGASVARSGLGSNGRARALRASSRYASRVRRWRRSVLVAASFTVLTALTQIGGLALLPAVLLERLGKGRAVLAFALGYAALFPAVAVIAPWTGRVRLPCLESEVEAAGGLRPATLWTCALHRSYATPVAREELGRLAAAMRDRFPGTETRYLDAGFPFGDGFPLVPHLSHDDGRKVDLALFRSGPAAVPRGDPARGPLGYFAYEPPRAGEPAPCRGVRSWLRWDLDALQPFVYRPLDAERTRAGVEWLAARERVARMFLEPHLKERLGLESSKVRFQGCQAARHDDHLHVEFRP